MRELLLQDKQLPAAIKRAVIASLGALKRKLYENDRPGRLMRVMNRVDALLYASGIFVPRSAATLEVAGRRTGTPVTLPVVVVAHDGERFLVSMLGENVNWVRNVRVAGGHAVLRRRGREVVTLEEIPPEHRAPVLRRYLAVAPGARPHLPVDRRAPLSDFERIAPQYPVFRVR